MKVFGISGAEAEGILANGGSMEDVIAAAIRGGEVTGEEAEKVTEAIGYSKKSKGSKSAVEAEKAMIIELLVVAFKHAYVRTTKVFGIQGNPDIVRGMLAHSLASDEGLPDDKLKPMYDELLPKVFEALGMQFNPYSDIGLNTH
ncbi:hypothetical protein HWC80_gp100 [Mycobacterium phage Indlulamithi]|uniref:Tail assembly chaperone n=1 Tax=Mycobacterium phage Indlulamithi TaxID=2656582 RepID=A0A649VDT2_9CAUD|nr:hypothetical protein HWC80_gp100 [Mycobacterium phage Indlulamithi]QGJ90112.1 hypothetical protein PBI_INDLULAMITHI_74 [Mycobacterium phage Indlulamithi]